MSNEQTPERGSRAAQIARLNDAFRRPPNEASAVNFDEVYEQNHYSRLLELLGRISARLSVNYRNDRPRTSEHIGQQEEVIAMLQDVADYLEA